MSTSRARAGCIKGVFGYVENIRQVFTLQGRKIKLHNFNSRKTIIY